MPAPTSRVVPIENGGMVMITDHGEHAPSFYAEVAARQLAPLGPNLTGQRLRAAQAFQIMIADVLEKHHDGLHAREGELLASKGMEHADAEVKLEDTEVRAAMDEISAAVKGTEWAEKFLYGNRPAWLDQREADIAELGTENVEPLGVMQKTELDWYLRTQAIRQIIGTHMATHKHVRRRHHAGQLAAKKQ